ncbi:hypothetical protein B0T24DRAFT_421364 [Lasiosphaeria ovina]|uniref:DUF7924 domain-containing protein n=1 Tax=Lasiosphaeria ovina TaxID=92902 RepID=A0AAE0JVS3_9PEZI|nr:hypothetical protein B0T24DRAFT_421364 [Lasiosphaeria ovina]
MAASTAILQQQQRRSARLARRDRDKDRDNDPISNRIAEEDDDDIEFKDPNYHDYLKFNYIFFQHPQKQLPDTVAAHVAQMASTISKMPELSPETVTKVIYGLNDLGLGCDETQVGQYFKDFLFPKGDILGFLTRILLTQVDEQIARHLVPNNPAALSVVSQPRPNLLYGYPSTAFTSDQLITLSNLHPQINNYAKAATKLFLPFFAVEFKATAGTGGSLWVAGNQCAGASAACVQAVNQLNTRLGGAGYIRRIPNLCYSLALDNNLALLYISWGAVEEGGIYIQRVAYFMLSSLEEFTRLHQWVAAILDWGRRRLRGIKLGLDHIAQAAQQKVVFSAAKSRPGPQGRPEGGPARKRRRLGGGHHQEL